MIDLSGLVLSGMLTYGIWALGLATLVSAIGVPLPATIDPARRRVRLHAQGVLNWRSGGGPGRASRRDARRYRRLYLLATVARAAKLAFRRVQTSGRLGPVAESVGALGRAGGVLLAVACRLAWRCRSICWPAAHGCALWRYLGLVVAGEALWVMTFGGMGYLFADQWEAVSALMGNLSGAVAAATLGLTGAGILLRRAWAPRPAVRHRGDHPAHHTRASASAAESATHGILSGRIPGWLGSRPDAKYNQQQSCVLGGSTGGENRGQNDPGRR